MDLLYNPFSPGAGTLPPELVGREEILNQALLALARVKRGRSEKSILLVGLCVTGKTVGLREISSIAKRIALSNDQNRSGREKMIFCLKIS